jgi:LmbE family N-acetylglucosaminyl deacetylase
MNHKSAEISDGDRVLRLPHFRLVGAELFFLISRRPYVRLSDPELAVWAALDGDPSVDELRGRFGAQADRALGRFTELGLCELAPPGYPTRRRVLVFEPHNDDAALSVGGTMWLRRHDCEFVVIAMASRSNFTSYYELDRDYFDVDQITRLRNAEGQLFARLVGGQHRTLDLLDAPLRYRGGQWSLDWYRRHRHLIPSFIDHHFSDEELTPWIAAVRAAMRDLRADEVWIPLGTSHADHELARIACLRVLLEDPALAEGREVRLYQEVPYAARFAKHAESVVNVLTRQGARLSPEDVDIGAVFADKLRLVSVYASQFKLKALQADIEASARMAAGGEGLAERFWRLERLPGALEPLAFWTDEPAARLATQRLAGWIRRHGQADRIRILLLLPAGRWAEDMERTLRAFPRAHFEVYCSPAAAAEVTDFTSPRIHVHHVDGGTRSWLRLALRLALGRPLPTLFLSGEKRLREARWLAALWPGSDTVVAASMNHLVLAIRQLAESRPGSP